MAFLFPQDESKKAGAIRINADGNSFHVPVVIYGPDGVTPITSANPLSTQIAGRTVQNHTFQDAATVVGDGTAFTVAGFTTLIVEIYGTSTSRTVDFKGVGPSGATYAIIGELITSEQGLPPAKGTTGTGEVWRFNIAGLTSVSIAVSAVAGGNVSVKGKAVA